MRCTWWRSQTLIFEYEVAPGDLTNSLALSDRHALVFGFNATFGSSGYESKLRSLVAQASTNPTLAAERVGTQTNLCHPVRGSDAAYLIRIWHVLDTCVTFPILSWFQSTRSPTTKWFLLGLCIEVFRGSIAREEIGGFRSHTCMGRDIRRPYFQ